MPTDAMRATWWEKKKKYYLAHPKGYEKHKERVEMWQKNHPEKVKEYKRRSYFKKKQSMGEKEKPIDEKRKEKVEKKRIPIRNVRLKKQKKPVALQEKFEECENKSYPKDEFYEKSRQNMLDFYSPELRQMMNEGRVRPQKYGNTMIIQFQRYSFLKKVRQSKGAIFEVSPEIVAKLSLK